MKKILIVSQAMEIGGAETALLGLLNAIDKSEFQIDLFLLRHSGELLKYIPSHVTLLPEKREYSMLAVSLMRTLKQRFFGIFYGRLMGRIKARKYACKNGFKDRDMVNNEYSHKYTVNYMPFISDQEYDCAISFLSPHYFVAQKVKAKIKIAWIHTDYETVEIDVDSELRMWSKYDYIASISENVTQGFLKTFPNLKGKIILFGNIMPIDYIKKLANSGDITEEMPYENNTVLLSIGRFCTAKNFDNIPSICKKITDAGERIKWYLIGYGPDEELIRNKIQEFGMEEHICILGKKENPYPYIQRCDIYIQPSRYEGKCVAVIEAQIFHKPVIISAYATSCSQLEDGVDGVIVPMDNEGCAKGIIEVITNQKLQGELIQATMTRNYTNSDEINKLYKLLE